ncbi:MULTISPECIES: gliding motility lipoprotein GldH [unclassified Mucilaginibacter]|uniref:gliding motility lipoprotein GldH n=1 Tax=unclassified Mucilaginibacter TaxID=2617802 RepID=UPI000966004D|nr:MULTISPECIES: gliding motility lipoprotein GldH [unclassified Mucilaginibacter]OJW17379.1 MAG: gliding motility lipoprotein GldH [Mucilaginibacter sp. 44-25]
MKRFKQSFLILASVMGFMLQGCTDASRVMDDSTAIANHNWAYVNRVKYDADITDNNIPYNLYFNLRVTGSYRYSNMFILVRMTSPGKRTRVTRYELKLANPDGEWLGSGSGNMYSYQIPFRKGFKFPASGKWHFELEQNMRDNPLHEVTDVGLRVEKAGQQ